MMESKIFGEYNMKNKIDKETIKKLMELVRMDISEEEKEGLLNDLNSILKYINQLNEIPTDDIELGLEIEKIFLRDDIVWQKDKEDIIQLIDSFREKQDNKLKVPYVIGEGE
jgi:aspartyl-tRNA(Asn)/glutamyl-tRNA(Gln) amidotransferase subunit C